MSGVLVLLLRILLAVSLYGFLAVLLVTLWRDLRTQAEVSRTQNLPPLWLTVKGQPTGKGSRFAVPNIILGRSPESDYPVLDDTVSAHHAALNYHHRQWWLEDLSSTNGTFLNGERMLTPTVIISGDEIRLGQVELRVTLQPE